MLYAHSLAEAHLYLKITACSNCNPESARPRAVEITIPTEIAPQTLSAACPSCGAARSLALAIPGDDHAPADSEVPPVNCTNECSRLIDVGQWTTLASIYIEQAQAAATATEARRLHLQAAQCLDEALKFYDDPDNDLPAADAFFTDASRTRFREAPHQFSRQRLISQRRKLPLPLKPSA